MTRARSVRRAAAALAAALMLGAPSQHLGGPSIRISDGARRRLFILHSANAPREARGAFRRYFGGRDYARVESLPADFRVSRIRRYALATTLRRRWAGELGVRHWIREGCGPGTPGTIVYDPERRALTPDSEQRRFPRSVRRAERLVRSTGCHVFGLAPGPALLFGLDAGACDYDPREGDYEHIPWRAVEILDIQAQRLVGDDCVDQGGMERYVAAIAFLAEFVRSRNPEIAVVSQLSFRDGPPARMVKAIASVAHIVDGIYLSYPSSNQEAPCRYCSPSNFKNLLAVLRG